MQVKLVPVEKIIPYASNPRKNAGIPVAKVKASLKEFGWRQPIVVDSEGVIIVGHTRYQAALELGMTEIPVHVAEGLTAAQVKAYRIADNKTGDFAEWDFDLLKLEFADLQDLDFSLDLTGFDDDAIDGIMVDATPEGNTDPDEVPDVPDEPVSKPGDVWVMGNHRLMCGDSTDAESVARLMNGARADLCFTSPPYGQQRDYTEEGKEKCQDWNALMFGVFSNLPMSESGQVLVNLGMIHRDGEWVPYWDAWIEWMRSQGWRRFGMYVWDQGFGLPGDWNGRFAPSHELVFHFNKVSVEPKKFLEKKPENIKARSNGASTMRGKDGKCKAFTNPEASAQPNKIPESVIRINRMHGGHDIDHPAIFPVELPLHAMSAWPGVVYEPFCGSGTTLIAAEQSGGRCYGMEIGPKYCDVIVKRWEDFTGKKAVLEESNAEG